MVFGGGSLFFKVVGDLRPLNNLGHKFFISHMLTPEVIEVLKRRSPFSAKRFHFFLMGGLFKPFFRPISLSPFDFKDTS